MPSKKQPVTNKRSGKLPLVLGILATFPGIFLNVIGIILSILAIIFGALQMKNARTSYAKAGLILGIVSLVINIVLSVLVFGFVYSILAGNREIETMGYDEAKAVCLSKASYLQRTLCLGPLIENNLDNPEVQSGEICSSLSEDAEKIFCVLQLSGKTSNESHCNILEEGDGRTLCLAIVRKDKSLCNQLSLNVRARCLDEVSRE
jgi:hypothetical protein